MLFVRNHKLIEKWNFYQGSFQIFSRTCYILDGWKYNISQIGMTDGIQISIALLNLCWTIQNERYVLWKDKVVISACHALGSKDKTGYKIRGKNFTVKCSWNWNQIFHLDKDYSNFRKYILSKPNVLFIMTDDQGFSDVSWRNKQGKRNLHP